MTRKRARFNPRISIEELDRLLHRPGGERVAVWTEGETDDAARPRQRLDLRARRHVPHAHRPVGRAGGERAPVGAEGDGADVSGVAREPAQLAPGLRVPEPRGVVGAARSDEPRVGAEGERVHAHCVACLEDEFGAGSYGVNGNGGGASRRRRERDE